MNQSENSVVLEREQLLQRLNVLEEKLRQISRALDRLEASEPSASGTGRKYRREVARWLEKRERYNNEFNAVQAEGRAIMARLKELGMKVVNG
ncbi:hypothetical protein [Alicyclobacillus kakegawensis]|uniref:hypothetical protein n=1 Tax=Alicyclobacillus kakegawensis TaxID=392012 RepID=UPI000832054F|nr:hypothetical protein [Alicyclobacillus kakegawensis]